METTIRINSSMLDVNVLEGIRKLFPNKNVIITIKEDKAEEEVSFIDE
jgi:hypothetical protein